MESSSLYFSTIARETCKRKEEKNESKTARFQLFFLSFGCRIFSLFNFFRFQCNPQMQNKNFLNFILFLMFSLNELCTRAWLGELIWESFIKNNQTFFFTGFVLFTSRDELKIIFVFFYHQKLKNIWRDTRIYSLTDSVLLQLIWISWSLFDFNKSNRR